MRSATIADCYRSYGNTRQGVCDGRCRTIWVIGRVELGSTFSTITTMPTKKDFNENAYLGRPAASNSPMRTEMFAAIFEPNVIQTI